MNATFHAVKPGFTLSTQQVASAPFVHITFTLRRGTSCETPDQFGYLSALGTMLTRGCGELDRGAFAHDCDRRGANIQVYPSRDFFTVEVWILPEDLEWALTTLEQMLWQPALDPEEVATAAQEQILQLRARDDEKRSVLWDTCRREFFQSSHHYSRRLVGGERSLAKLDARTLGSFREGFLEGAGAVLCVTGGFEQQELDRILADRFTQSAFNQPTLNGRSSPFADSGGRAIAVPFPVSQAEVLIAIPAMPRQASNYRLGVFCNEAFGGAFLSRLTRAVRMKEGMAYSAESRLRAGLDGGILWVGLQTDVPRLQPALELVRSCMDELAKNGLPEGEFNHFKEFVAHSMPFDYDGISALTSRRLEEVLFSEPWSLESRLEQFHGRISLSQSDAMFQEMLRPQDALVCILGEGVEQRWGEVFFETPRQTFSCAPLDWLPEPSGRDSDRQAERLHTHPEGELYRLSNGMALLSLPRMELASVSLQVWSMTGAMDEKKGETGLSHLLEHLMFRGTPAVPDGHFDAILAQRGGLNNAFTTEDFTVYLDQVTLGGLESALMLEADRFSKLEISEELFQTELSVVMEERSMRVDCNPLGKAYESLQSLAFRDSHPYGHPVIGWREDLESCRLESLRGHYRFAARPEKMLIVIAGGCPSEKAARLAEKTFGEFGETHRPGWPVEASEQVPSLRRASLELRERSGYSYLLLCYRFPRQGHPDYEACELLNRVLGEGDSCRLYETFVRHRERVQEVWSSLEAQTRDHPLMHFGMATPEELSSQLAEEVRDYLAEVHSELTQDDLDKARRVWFSEDAYSRDDLEDWALEIAGRVMLMDWERVWGQRDRMNGVTLTDLKRVAQRYLTSDGAVHLILHGES
jgi:zinc protease